MIRSAVFGALAVTLVAVAAACGGSEEPTAVQARAAPAEARLTIRHVEDGCHVWSDGRRETSVMTLPLATGGTLSVLNNDIDVHRLVQVGGPGLALGGPMMMGGKAAIFFPKPGTYRLRTEVVEIEGMDEMMEVETEGPDNELELRVQVS